MSYEEVRSDEQDMLAASYTRGGWPFRIQIKIAHALGMIEKPEHSITLAQERLERRGTHPQFLAHHDTPIEVKEYVLTHWFTIMRKA